MRKSKIILSVSLSLVLLLLLPAAMADTAFSFRNGVTWDTTIAEMMAAEGLQEGDGTYNRREDNGFIFFYLKSKQVYYVFRGDRLVNAYSPMAGGTYAAQLEQQTARYGAPADISADTVSNLLNLMRPNSTAPDDFSDLTTWRLDDGTLAALFTINGESYMAYFHQQRIAGVV